MPKTKAPKPPDYNDMVVVEVNCSTGIKTERKGTAKERKARQASWRASLPARVEEVRGERNRLLAQSDWTQLPDAPLTDKQRVSWTEYRRALRDMKFGLDPDAIEFPEEPQS